jgi:hypothetical protein
MMKSFIPMAALVMCFVTASLAYAVDEGCGHDDDNQIYSMWHLTQ